MALSFGMDLGSMRGASLTVAAILGSLALPFYIGFGLDRRRWWLLIPAYILTFVTIILTTDALIAHSILRTGGASKILMAFSSGAGIMFMLALPFFVAYFWSKKNWWALIPAGGFTSIGLMILLQFLDSYSDKNTGIFIGVMLLGVAATFAVLWLRRKNQPTDWAKYPAVGLFVAAALTFVVGDGWSTLSTQENAIAFAVGSAVFFLIYFLSGIRKWGWLFPALGCAAFALMNGMSSNYPPVPHLFFVLLMASLALPFYVGFALDRKRRGLLIPALLGTYATIFILIADSNLEEGSSIMFLFALPFFVLYFWSKKNWWAFIPAGVFASIGVVVVLETLVPHEEYPSLPNTLSFDALSWVLLLGLSATFGVLWLRRKTQPTAWAAYPAAGFLAAAVLFLILGEHFQEVWFPIILLVTGGTFLLATFIKKLPAAGQQLPDGKA
jgi:hypothetical protein